MKKNIAIVINSISSVGGTERAAINLANALNRYKTYDVLLISLFGSANAFFNTSCKIVYLQSIKQTQSRINKLNYIKIVKRVNEIIKKYSISVVIGTTHASNCIISLVNNNVKKIGWEHLIFEECPFYSNIVRNILYRKLDYLVVLSEPELSKYRSLPFSKKSVIYNMASFELEDKSSLTDNRIIYVGRLEKIKRVGYLLEIAKILKKRIPEWRIDIFGEGEEQEYLEKTIKEYGLDDYVKIYGYTNNIIEEYMHSSMIVLTSRSEGLPMVLIEAQTCGLPAVCIDCPNGPKEIIEDGVDGFLIPSGDSSQFVDRVVDLAMDIQFRSTMGEKAKKRSSRFCIAEISNEWNRIIEKIINGSNEDVC